MTVTNYQAKLWLKLQERIAKRKQEERHRVIVTHKSDKNVKRFPSQLRLIA